MPRAFPRRQPTAEPRCSQTETNPDERPLHGEARHGTLGEHAAPHAEEDGHPLLVLCTQVLVRRHVGDVDRYAEPAGETQHDRLRLIAESALGLGEEHGVTPVDAVHDPTMVARVRPATAAVVVGLLLLILVAFVVKAQTSGFTP